MYWWPPRARTPERTKPDCSATCRPTAFHSGTVGPQSAVEGDGPGVGDGGAAEVYAQASARKVGPDADGDVEHGGVAGLPRRPGGLAQAAEAEQRVLAVGHGPVTLVRREGLEGVIDLPSRGLGRGGQGQSVLNGQLADVERRDGLCALVIHALVVRHWSKSKTTRSAAGCDWQASAYPAATSPGSRA